MEQDRLVNLDEVIKALKELHDYDLQNSGGIPTPDIFDWGRAVNRLEHIPLVHAVEVVRCRECKYRTQSIRVDKRAPKGMFIYGCEKIPGGYFGESGYCSLGVKEETK